jgi:hypothetical protein
MVFRNYAISGYAMATGGVGLIPPQFDRAVADSPDIKAVIMTGGVNDIFIPDTTQYPQSYSCKNDANAPNIADCQKIVKRALDAFSDLLDRMAKAGVKDVVYFYYPRMPALTVNGGTNPNEITDYARPKYKEICDGTSARSGGKLNCRFLDLSPILDDQDGQPVITYFATADINPNSIGSVRMAREVWTLMTRNCIAQPASSGCCTK